MRQLSPVVKGVDHVVIRVENPARLFKFFTQSLKLPVAWELSTEKYICTGGVFLGNACLEIISYQPIKQGKEQRTPKKASLFGIAFEPYDFSQALQELRLRGFPHSCPIPYQGRLKPFRTDFDFISSHRRSDYGWTMSLLGGLLDGSTPPYSLGKYLSANKMIFNLYGKLLGNLSRLPTGSWYINRSLGSSTFSLIEYPHDTHKLATQRQQELSTGKGGTLGILRLDEIVIGVKDYQAKRQRWQTLLTPLPEVSAGVWRLEDGIALHLIPHPSDRLVSLSIRVSDLPQARQFLEQNDWLDREPKDGVFFSPSALDGLRVQLIA